MATVHWTLWPGAGQDRFDLDHLRRAARETSESGRPAWRPSADVLETAQHFVIILEVPGVEQDDVAVEIREDALWIVGRRRRPAQAAQGGFTLVERQHGPFARAFKLGRGLDYDAVTARLSQGVLEITIPKHAAQPSRRRIDLS